MTTVQIANTLEENPRVDWDMDCDQWITFDLDGMPHWDSTRQGVIAKVIEANNIIMEHLAKCPTDEGLLIYERDWEDDPVNFKCY